MTVADPINMLTLENAVYDWFSEVTGLSNVIWEEQSKLMPAYPYGTLNWIGFQELGGRPETRFEEAPEPVTPEEELVFTTNTPCLMTVSCQVKVGQDDACDPTKNGVNYINRAKASLGLITTKAAFKTAEIGYVRSVLSRVPTKINEAWISRAVLEVTFGVVLSLVEYETYIEKFYGVSTELGIAKTFE